MTKIYAVIDTNVIVSALYSHKTDAATILVLDYLTQGILQPLVNNEILISKEIQLLTGNGDRVVAFL